MQVIRTLYLILPSCWMSTCHEASYVFLVCLMMVSGARAGLPQPDLPTGIKGYWISEDMVFNGFAFNMRGFHVRSSLQEQTAVFKGYLQQFGNPVVVSERDGWTQVAVKGNEAFYVAQLAADLKGVQGTLSISALEGDESYLEQDQYPFGIVKVSEQVYNDPGSQREMNILMSGKHMPVTRDNLITYFEETGWQVVNQPAENRVYFRKNSQSMLMFLQKRRPSRHTHFAEQGIWP